MTEVMFYHLRTDYTDDSGEGESCQTTLGMSRPRQRQRQRQCGLGARSEVCAHEARGAVLCWFSRQSLVFASIPGFLLKIPSFSIFDHPTSMLLSMGTVGLKYTFDICTHVCYLLTKDSKCSISSCFCRSTQPRTFFFIRSTLFDIREERARTSTLHSRRDLAWLASSS